METLDVKIKYLPDSPPLEKTEIGSWIDLYVYEDTYLRRGEQKYISMGVAMQLPDGYEAILAPRSSTFKRYGIMQSNHIGVIDSSYAGDNDIWAMPVYAFKDVHIPKGARICQFRIQKEQPKLNFITVESLGNADRLGFGSTGA